MHSLARRAGSAAAAQHRTGRCIIRGSVLGVDKGLSYIRGRGRRRLTNVNYGCQMGVKKCRRKTN